MDVGLSVSLVGNYPFLKSVRMRKVSVYH
ncbi:Protein of unknown function [Anaplasma phagocytophilum]|uniref:Uncharacterized protein n=1 Tax=Anaplasma phagocytophilum TaxID=948 RepID=A0A098EDL0_ANAPH|nr:Protein of unknown function [Anaplasma phagocytophilum]